MEPSINETIRDSIKYSFVSSENGDEGLERNNEEQKKVVSDTTRDTYVMNRMNWITYLKVLFDELETFASANMPSP